MVFFPFFFLSWSRFMAPIELQYASKESNASAIFVGVSQCRLLKYILIPSLLHLLYLHLRNFAKDGPNPHKYIIREFYWLLKIAFRQASRKRLEGTPLSS
jgi:hypothetical protein